LCLETKKEFRVLVPDKKKQIIENEPGKSNGRVALMPTSFII
jgi:hypothetical protein